MSFPSFWSWFMRRRRQGPVDTVVSASQSVVVLSAGTVVVGDTLTLTIYARNDAGEGITGLNPNSITGATVSGSGATNGVGLLTRQVSNAVGTGYTVLVTIGGVLLDDQPTFDVTAAPSGTNQFRGWKTGTFKVWK